MLSSEEQRQRVSMYVRKNDSAKYFVVVCPKPWLFFWITLILGIALVLWTVLWDGPKALTSAETSHLQAIVSSSSQSQAQSRSGGGYLSEHEKRQLASRGDFGASGMHEMRSRAEDRMMRNFESEFQRVLAGHALEADIVNAPIAKRRFKVKASAWFIWICALHITFFIAKAASNRREVVFDSIWGKCEHEVSRHQDCQDLCSRAMVYGFDSSTGSPRVLCLHYNFDEFEAVLDRELAAAGVDVFAVKYI